jgi:glycosyltransferase involved in cell wall biosynthesis
MKILYITFYPDLYGANRSLLNQIDGLINQTNYEIMIICAKEGEFINEIKKRGIDYLVIPFKNGISRDNFSKRFFRGIYCFSYNLFLILKYYKILKRKKINIIHSNTSIVFFGAYLSKFLNTPHIWHIRELLSHYSFRYCFGDKYFFYWLKKSKKVICISNYVYQMRLKEMNINNALILYNGIISKKGLKLDYLLKSKKAANVFNFIFVGQLSKSKNPMTALRAFKKFSDKYQLTHLYIVGNGSEKEILNNFVNWNNLESKVTFTGFVENVSDYYRESEVLLMCSDKEALGRVTIEAMAHGLVVIGYNCGGTSEIIRDNVNGLLYDGGYSNLTEKMELVYTNRELYENLSENAIKLSEKFSIENYILELQRVYSSIIC